MPTMYDIYNHHADKYHELVSAEDCNENLVGFLRQKIDWNGKNVLEAGAGTGRVTGMYIEAANHAVCCDRSQHMLNFAKTNLVCYARKIDYKIADNLQLPDLSRKADVFIEGWSFGHTVSDGKTAAEIRQRTGVLIENASRNIVSGGVMVIVESLGTNVEKAEPPTEKLSIFLNEFSSKYKFHKTVINTDYKFPTNEDAVRIMGFFFGEDRVPEIGARNSGVIPEWTGVWIRETA